MKKSSMRDYELQDIQVANVTVWDEAQARNLDAEGVNELAKSIESEGLQSPPLVQEEKDGTYSLIMGQRRLAALNKLGVKTAPMLVLGRRKRQGMSDAKAISIIENLHRKNMSTAETAQACQYLVETEGKAKTAKMLGISRDTLREYLGFAAVPEDIKKMVPGKLSRRDAVRICKTVSDTGKAMQVAVRASKYNQAQRKRYLDALEKLGNSAEHAEISKLANSFRARQNITIKLSKSQAKGLARLSKQKEMEPAEFSHKILSNYLSKQGFKA